MLNLYFILKKCNNSQQWYLNAKKRRYRRSDSENAQIYPPQTKRIRRAKNTIILDMVFEKFLHGTVIAVLLVA